jgi:hypothetical protein
VSAETFGGAGIALAPNLEQALIFLAGDLQQICGCPILDGVFPARAGYHCARPVIVRANGRGSRNPTSDQKRVRYPDSCTRHHPWSRVRLSLRKAARSSAIPLSTTGNPGVWGTHGPLVQENPQVRFLNTFALTAEFKLIFDACSACRLRASILQAFAQPRRACLPPSGAGSRQDLWRLARWLG